MSYLASIILAVLMSPGPGQTPTTAYFPSGAFSRSAEANAREADLLGSYLEAADEPSLFSSSAPGEVYRFLWVPPFDDAILVRVAKNGRNAVLRLAIFPEARAESRPVVSTLQLKPEEWQRLREKIVSLGFWSSIENAPTEAGQVVIDSSYWLFEGRSDGRYKLVQRSPPDFDRDRDFINLGRTLLRTAGFDLKELGLAGTSKPDELEQSGPRENSAPSVDQPVLKIALDCEAFDGKRVATMGVMSLGNAEYFICPTKEFLSADPLNCLWLDLDALWRAGKLKRVAQHAHDGEYLLVEGTVACANGGPRDRFAATLKDLSIIVTEATGEVLWQETGTRRHPATDH